MSKRSGSPEDKDEDLNSKRSRQVANNYFETIINFHMKKQYIHVCDFFRRMNKVRKSLRKVMKV